MPFITTLDDDRINYTKTCEDFDHLGIDCCSDCHDEPDLNLEIARVDGENALLCHNLWMFFYPEGIESKLSPEEKLLRAIFREPHYDLDFPD